MLTEGEVMADACINLHTDYVDISGEIPYSIRLTPLHQEGC